MVVSRKHEFSFENKVASSDNVFNGLNSAAQDRVDQKNEEERLREEFAKQGIKIPKREEGENFDSNTITPGTPFMDRLAMALQWCVPLARS